MSELSLKDYSYFLPEELIAQNALENREESRLLVLKRNSGEFCHKHFYNIIEYLNEGDVLVLNNTRVIPARIFAHREDKSENIEFLLLKEVEKDIWECLCKPGKKVKIGTKIVFSDKLEAIVVNISEDGNRFIKFSYNGIFNEILEEIGQMPLPPYIHSKLKDKERYQTVYSKVEGSAAAPTAGLHFTKELLKKIEDKGVIIAYVTLHVGLGTFKPVKTENILEHHMHSEYFEISDETIKIINSAKDDGRRIVAVGTTSVRTLESATDDSGKVIIDKGDTSIFIYPGYKFKCVDAIITNFHLPESTLLMLVSAFATREIILKTYEKAIEEKYRFFSFGDAMFIY